MAFNLKKFKEDYNKYGKYDLEKQIPHLSALAEEYFQRYLNGRKWTDCLKVIQKMGWNISLIMDTINVYEIEVNNIF